MREGAHRDYKMQRYAFFLVCNKMRRNFINRISTIGLPALKADSKRQNAVL